MSSATLDDSPAVTHVRTTRLRARLVRVGVVRRRERRHPCRYAYMRRVSANRYQARLYIGPRKGDSVNLGLYETELAAWRAVQAVANRLPPGRPTPLSVWAAMLPLIAAGDIPRRVLPKYVRRGETGYVARAKLNGAAVVLGPFGTPEEACAAMCARANQDSASRKLIRWASAGAVTALPS